MDPAAAARELIAETRALPRQDTPHIRRLRRERSRAWKNEKPAFIHGVGLNLKSRRWLGYELVRFHKGAFAALNDELLERFGQDLNSWGEVDAFGRILVGPAWAVGTASDGLIEGWARSEDRWRRRLALVATVALNSPADGGSGDAPRTFRVCEALASDRDDMVVKALSWALRALAVRNPEIVRDFVTSRAHLLAARVRREVTHKLETGRKNPCRSAGLSWTRSKPPLARG